MAVRWLVRTQKCASVNRKLVSRQTENKEIDTLAVPHQPKRLSSNGSIPEKFKEELAEKASLSELCCSTTSISLEDEGYSYLLTEDDENTQELFA